MAGSEPTPALQGPWRAVVSGCAGFVITDQQLRDWMDDEDTLGEGLAPDEVSVVRGSAMPKPAPIDAERMPGSYASNDVLYTVDVASTEPADVLLHWERAQAVAAALNGVDRDALIADAELPPTAQQLLEEGLHLCAHGERAPGGDETWAEWALKVETYLRELHGL